MNKHRLVSTCFWDDGYIMKLDPSEKLLFMYLLTNPLTNICGVYQIELRRIAFDTGFDQEVVSTILKRFARDEKCVYLGGWLAMRNWLKHQNPSPKVVKGIEKQLESVPEPLKRYVRGYGIDTASHLNPNPNPNLNLNPPKKEGDVESSPRRLATPQNVEKVIDYLNLKTGRKFSSKTKATMRIIYARINEGHHFADFQRVIDAKVKQWWSDPKMADYLRPETLFGTKFDSYLATCDPLKVKPDESRTASSQFDLEEYERSGNLVKKA
jgi:uncharacterized phage protein (TIGR02220 family)